MVGGQWARYSFCSRTGLDASNGRRVGAPYSHVHRRDSTKSGFVWKFVYLLLIIVIIWCAVPGHSYAVDQYIKNLPRRSNALPESAKKMSDGLAGLHTVSAKDLPGILMQVVSFLCVFSIISYDFGRCLSQLDLTAATNFQSRSQRKYKRQFIFSLFCTAQDMQKTTPKMPLRWLFDHCMTFIEKTSEFCRNSKGTYKVYFTAWKMRSVLSANLISDSWSFICFCTHPSRSECSETLTLWMRIGTQNLTCQRHFQRKYNVFDCLLSCFRWEHFHVDAAKRIYQRTAKRTRSLIRDMENELSRVEKYDFVFEKVLTCWFLRFHQFS